MEKLTGWGNYPAVDAQILMPEKSEVASLSGLTGIPRGLGRSYGDSALSSNVISSKRINRFVSFDATSGVLQCDAGVSLGEILELIVPRGRFLAVTPGTKFVSVGGAIASDVHGKNHHLSGCFSDCVESLTIATGQQILECSRQHNADLFYATCGGMGLTGLILEARIRTVAIASSNIEQRTLKAENLTRVLELFEQHAQATYSVAWIDCLATGDDLGRSLLMLGEHAPQGEIRVHNKGKLSIPFNFPTVTLNQFSIQAFNFLYYNRVRAEDSRSTIHYDPFFYPLDGINHWNRMYGKNGFTQYQFVIPKAAGLEGLSEILAEIARSKQGSFLSVLKVLGKENANMLSFPTEGYTLALDFKMGRNVLDLLERLDKIVRQYQGRLYLTKDARMSEQMFKESYPRWEEFQQVREKYAVDSAFSSLQSKRIGLSK